MIFFFLFDFFNKKKEMQPREPYIELEPMRESINVLINSMLSIAKEHAMPKGISILLQEKADRMLEYAKIDCEYTTPSQNEAMNRLIHQRFEAFVNLVLAIRKLNPKVSDSKIVKLYVYTSMLTRGLSTNMYLCGGFVRDLFTEDQENDLDIWASYKWHARDVIGDLQDAGFELTYDKPKKCNHYMFQEEHWKVACKRQLGDQMLEFTIDLAMGGGFHQYGLDYQCNALYLYRDSQYDNYNRETFNFENGGYGPEWKFGVRVYEPLIPKFFISGHFVYIPPEHTYSCDEIQFSHDYFTRHYREQLTKPNPTVSQDHECKSDYCRQSCKARTDEADAVYAKLHERIAKLPLPPSVDTVISEIQSKKLVQVAYCDSLMNEDRSDDRQDQRLKHMLAKGYLP
jgi:hypothetical protein